MPVRGDLQARLERAIPPAPPDAAPIGARADDGGDSAISPPARGPVAPENSRERASSPASGAWVPPATGVGPAAERGSVYETLGTLSAEVEKLRFELAMVQRVEARQRGEIVRLERRIAVLETERRELIDQVAHRDRLLTLIQSSRSWRWTQALRRRLGRR